MIDGRQPDYGRATALVGLAVVVPVGICLIVYWAIMASFPEITLRGWLVVCAYVCMAVGVPTAVTPVLSRAINLERYTFGRAWRVVALVWVAITAIAGLLAWPAVASYIKPLFVGGL
jgi:hypothetical protein